MLLVQDPQVLLLDEPVAGHDPPGDRAHRRAGEVAGAAAHGGGGRARHGVRAQHRETVTVLHEGSVLAEGPMEKVQGDPKVIEVYLGT